MKQYNILCGSKSCSRLDAIRKLPNLGDLRVVAPSIDEAEIAVDLRKANNAEELVLYLGRAKADAVAQRFRETSSGDPDRGGHQDWIIVTGDQVVVHRGAIREKPKTREEVYELYKAYSETDSSGTSYPVSTVGSVVVTELRSGLQVSAVDIAELEFETPVCVDDLHQLFPSCMNCAGALMVEHPAITRHIVFRKGTYESALGLEPATLTRLLVDLERQRSISICAQ